MILKFFEPHLHLILLDLKITRIFQSRSIISLSKGAHSPDQSGTGLSTHTEPAASEQHQSSK